MCTTFGPEMPWVRPTAVRKSGEENTRGKKEKKQMGLHTCYLLSNFTHIIFATLKGVALRFTDMKPCSEMGRHSLLSGGCASRKRAPTDTQGFSSSLPVTTKSLVCVP